MRTTLVLVLGLLLVAFVVATVVVDRLATGAIEESTTQALGVSASLDRATVNLLTGGFTLSDLEVDNAEGFEAEHVIRMGSAEGRISLTTFLDEVVELPRLTLSDLDLYLERRGGSGNYEPILAHYIQEGREMGDPDRRYVIHELDARDIVVHLDFPSLAGQEGVLSVPIDEIRLAGVGEAGVGVALQEVVGTVTRALLEAALQRAAEEVPGMVLDELSDRLPDLPDLEGVLP